MYALDTKENFSLEVKALQDKIQEQIAASATHASAIHEQPNNDLVGKLNVLKQFDYKLGIISEVVGTMSEEKWLNSKEDLSNQFKHIATEFSASGNK